MTYRRIATGILAAGVAACNPAPSAPPRATSGAPPSIVPTVQATSVPSPSAIPVLDGDSLEPFQLEDSGATGICDPEPDGATTSGFRLYCYDTLRLALRSLRTEMPSVDRLYMSRATCESPPCGPNSVAIIGWLGDDAWTVYVDDSDVAITVPVPGAAAPWPSPTSAVAPPVERPFIRNAAREMRRREPYPFCGFDRPTTNTPESWEKQRAVNQCFFDAILDGRPIEMIVITEVTRQPALFRFDGQGPVIRYLEETDGPVAKRGWYRAEGPVYLSGSVYHAHAFNLTPVKVE